MVLPICETFGTVDASEDKYRFNGSPRTDRTSMFFEHIWVVVGFTAALSAVLTTIRPMTKRNPFYI